MFVHSMYLYFPMSSASNTHLNTLFNTQPLVGWNVRGFHHFGKMDPTLNGGADIHFTKY